MSGIVINIDAGATFEESTVHATGSLVNIIADSEEASFGIGSDAALKRAIGKYFGREPSQAYLKSPTPGCGVDSLYKWYGWPEVQRVLRPIKAAILDVTTKPTILSTQTLTNESNKTATYHTKISEEISNTVSNEWTDSNKVSAEYGINFSVSFLGIGGGAETKFGFEQEWGKSKTVSKQITAGMETGVTVELKPGESAIVELSASSGTMRVRVTYEAHLTGGSAVNYQDPFKDHRHWSLPIEGIVGDANSVQIVEDIEVGYYSKATARVKNAKTNEAMVFHMADHANKPPPE